MSRLHRNNAAERMMVIVLTPVAWIIRLFKHSLSPKVEKKKASRRRAVMIEGLPDRTMN